MATVFIGLVLITLVANAVITKSKTQWWRDPGSLFRAGSEPEPLPAHGNARVRQPWEVTPRQELGPRRELVGHSMRNPSANGGRHAMRSNPAPRTSSAVPIEHAETEVIARIPGGRARH